MLAQIFKAVLITSLAGSVLSIVITLLKPVTKKVFGYSWHYYIWLAVLFVMIAPVRFSLPQNSTDITAQNTQTAQTEQITENVQTDIADTMQTTNAATITAVQRATNFIGMILDDRMNYIGIIWVLGMIFSLLININGYARLIIKIHKNSVVISCPETANFTDKKITVRKGRDLSSPFILGIFRPTLVLPDTDLSAEQLNNILRHEMTHFKRKDILYKWFALFVRSIHWFNPVVHYAARQINNECEISCDLSVVSRMSKDEKISYINTILSLVSGDRVKRVPLTTQMASGKKVLKRRFTMIKNVKKTSKFMSALSAVTAVVMLGTTVFASGVLSDLTTDDYTIEITNKGEKIELSNKPFIENGEVYVPLRETIEKSDKNAEVTWNNGAISIDIVGNKYLMFIENYSISVNPIEKGEATFAVNAYKYPILKDSTTYIPFDTLVYLFTYGQNNNYSFVYKIYDKNGNPIDKNYETTARTSEPEPKMLQQDSEFLDVIVSACLRSYNYVDEYSYSLKSREYSDKNNRLKLYIEILPTGLDSFDYLTVTLVKTGENDWSIDDFFLEK